MAGGFVRLTYAGTGGFARVPIEDEPAFVRQDSVAEEFQRDQTNPVGGFERVPSESEPGFTRV